MGQSLVFGLPGYIYIDIFLNDNDLALMFFWKQNFGWLSGWRQVDSYLLTQIFGMVHRPFYTDTLEQPLIYHRFKKHVDKYIIHLVKW